MTNKYKKVFLLANIVGIYVAISFVWWLYLILS